MKLRLPPLATLRVFHAAARLQSFKLAAAELGLTPSAVSHSIIGLEKWLQVDLFRRHGRDVTLTPMGQQFLPYVSEGLASIVTGTERVTSAHTEHRIAISASPTFAARWLVPRLQSFRRAYPNVSIAIDTFRHLARFPLDGVDLAIHTANSSCSRKPSELLFRETLVPVATRRYLETVTRGGKLEWSRASILRVTSVEDDWATWLAKTGGESPRTVGNLYFHTADLAAHAATEGLGIAIGREPIISSELASGRLVRASDIVVAADTGYWLTSAVGSETRREIRAFRRWILSQVRSEPDLPQSPTAILAAANGGAAFDCGSQDNIDFRGATAK